MEILGPSHVHGPQSIKAAQRVQSTQQPDAVNDNAPNGETSSAIPHDDLMRAKFLRAMYSNKQLVEVLAEYHSAEAGKSHLADS